MTSSSSFSSDLSRVSYSHFIVEGKRWSRAGDARRSLECFLLADTVRRNDPAFGARLAKDGKDAKLATKIEQLHHALADATATDSDGGVDGDAEANDENRSANRSSHQRSQLSSASPVPGVASAETKPASTTLLLTPIDGETSRYARFRYSGDVAVLATDAVHGRYRLNADLYAKLHSWQREGVWWLCSLHARNAGGILGDDMGLGKTIQSSTFISTLVLSGLAHAALLLAPLAVIGNWKRELAVWCPALPVFDYHDATEAKQRKGFESIVTGGGLLLVNIEAFTGKTGTRKFFDLHAKYADFAWDSVIIDEGHRIKNDDCHTTKSIKCLPSKHRVLLTGTPIQNKLDELWCLFDFACNGALLGEKAVFRKEWAKPIEDGMSASASHFEQSRAKQRFDQLRARIAPHILRREKSMIRDLLVSALPAQKNDLCVWIPLTAQQIHLYRQCLLSDELKALLNTTRSPLAALTLLKKVCDHPKLIHHGMKYAGLETSDTDDAAEFDVANESVDSLIAGSNKLRVLLALLVNHRAGQHRTLIFSQSVRMLVILERVMTANGFRARRIDGTVKQSDRELLLAEFRSDPTIECCLLSTGVGGVGLNLTMASRVIIYDLSWNPAVDSQAVDRCFRLGQQRNVIVHRLVTCSTIDEVIYRKQLFKSGLAQTIQQQSHARRGQPSTFTAGHFTREELREVFRVPENPRHSLTCAMLSRKYPSALRQSYEELESHLRYIQSACEIVGITDHDLVVEAKRRDRQQPQTAAEPESVSASEHMPTAEEGHEAIEQLRATAASHPHAFLDCDTTSDAFNTMRANRDPSTKAARAEAEGAKSIDLSAESDDEDADEARPSADSGYDDVEAVHDFALMDTTSAAVSVQSARYEQPKSNTARSMDTTSAIRSDYASAVAGEITPTTSATILLDTATAHVTSAVAAIVAAHETDECSAVDEQPHGSTATAIRATDEATVAYEYQYAHELKHCEPEPKPLAITTVRDSDFPSFDQYRQSCTAAGTNGDTIEEGGEVATGPSVAELVVLKRLSAKLMRISQRFETAHAEHECGDDREAAPLADECEDTPDIKALPSFTPPLGNGNSSTVECTTSTACADDTAMKSKCQSDRDEVECTDDAPNGANEDAGTEDSDTPVDSDADSGNLANVAAMAAPIIESDSAMRGDGIECQCPPNLASEAVGAVDSAVCVTATPDDYVASERIEPSLIFNAGSFSAAQDTPFAQQVCIRSVSDCVADHRVRAAGNDGSDDSEDDDTTEYYDCLQQSSHSQTESPMPLWNSTAHENEDDSSDELQRIEDLYLHDATGEDYVHQHARVADNCTGDTAAASNTNGRRRMCAVGAVWTNTGADVDMEEPGTSVTPQQSIERSLNDWRLLLSFPSPEEPQPAGYAAFAVPLPHFLHGLLHDSESLSLEECVSVLEHLNNVVNAEDSRRIVRALTIALFHVCEQKVAARTHYHHPAVRWGSEGSHHSLCH